MELNKKIVTHHSAHPLSCQLFKFIPKPHRPHPWQQSQYILTWLPLIHLPTHQPDHVLNNSVHLHYRFTVFTLHATSMKSAWFHLRSPTLSAQGQMQTPNARLGIYRGAGRLCGPCLPDAASSTPSCCATSIIPQAGTCQNARPSNHTAHIMADCWKAWS